MNKAKSKSIRITTPPGVAIYPKLVEPDTKFNDDGVYSSLHRMDLRDVESTFVVDKVVHQGGVPAFVAFIKAEVDKLEEASNYQIKNDFFKIVVDENGNETGEIEARFTMKAWRTQPTWRPSSAASARPTWTPGARTGSRSSRHR